MKPGSVEHIKRYTVEYSNNGTIITEMTLVDSSDRDTVTMWNDFNRVQFHRECIPQLIDALQTIMKDWK